MNLHEGVSALPDSASSKSVPLPTDSSCTWLMNEDEFIKWLEKYGRVYRETNDEGCGFIED